jgi:hypothetical protein
MSSKKIKPTSQYASSDIEQSRHSLQQIMEECDNMFSDTPCDSKNQSSYQSIDNNPFASNLLDRDDPKMYNTMGTPSSRSSAKKAKGNEFERLLFADGGVDSEEEPEDFERDCASLTAKLRGFNLADPFMF